MHSLRFRAALVRKVNLGVVKNVKVAGFERKFRSYSYRHCLPLERCASGSRRLHTIQSVGVSVGRPGSVVAFSSATAEKIQSAVMKPFERLPKNAVPKHYRLTLTPNLKEFNFLGLVSVEIEVSWLLFENRKIVLKHMPAYFTCFLFASVIYTLRVQFMYYECF